MAGDILVLGATGNVGRPLVSGLVARGAAVRAASRGGAAVDGAAGARFDFRDPTTIGPALEGAGAVFVLAPGGNLDLEDLLLPVIRAAADRGVKVVLQSVFGVDASDDIPYRKVELELLRSGVPSVILRPNWFSDNFHSYWKAGVDHGVIAVPAGDGKSSFIDVRDIADSAAAALTSDRFDGQAFDLTGPQALGYGEAAAILSEVVGRPIRYEAIDDAAFVAMLTGAGVPEAYARFLASIFHPVREGWTARVTDAVETLTGRAARSVATYARDNADKLKA